MPAWVAEPGAAMAPGRPDDLQKEWQEARAVVGRLDGTLVDLRKYGFGLASGLLTANGLIFGLAGGSRTPSLIVAVVVGVTMLLAAVLFVVDQYYHMIQWSATNRATVLESYLSLGLSKEILRWARWDGPSNPPPAMVPLTSLATAWQNFTASLGYAAVGTTRFIWRNLAPFQYGSFVVVALALGAALMGSAALPWPTHAAGDLMWIVFLISMALIAMVRWLAGQERRSLSTTAGVIANAVRAVTVELLSPPTVNPGVTAPADLSLLAGDPDLAPGAAALAAIKPTAQGGLSIVGCTVLDARHVRVTFSNSETMPVVPTQGERYQVFVY